VAYALLRALAGVALRWYYRDIEIAGRERIPRRGPLLLVVNHPNALVDALLVGWIMHRRVLITAKATIFRNPIGGALLRWLGVLPLRRASDEPAAGNGHAAGAARNAETFQAVQDALTKGRCILIFPEGKTPDEPGLAPLKTGAARMALHARESGVRGLAILPIGLVFERKQRPRSRVFAEIGEPIALDVWQPRDAKSAAEALTAEIERRLRALTLSYPDADSAARASQLAMALASLIEPTTRLGDERGYAVETAIARQVESLTASLASGDDALRARAEGLVARLHAVQAEARQRGVALDDARIDVRRRSAFRFVLREVGLLMVGGPVALWGRINHWLPFGAARAIAMSNVESTADPAMRTIVAGAALVLIAYLAQTAIVWHLWGATVGALYLVSLPIAADINFSLTDRMRRAVRRATAYRALRRDAVFRRALEAELASLRGDVLEFNRAATAASAASDELSSCAQRRIFAGRPISPRQDPLPAAQDDRLVDRVGRTRQHRSAEVPVPRVASHAGAWILERAILQTFRRDSDRDAVGEQEGLVRRHEMREPTSLPQMAVQPQPTIHGVDHSFTTFRVFAILRSRLGRASYLEL
jgi:1-acyl-sn-glycerol-3-phosphate acyltransferase